MRRERTGFLVPAFRVIVASAAVIVAIAALGGCGGGKNSAGGAGSSGSGQAKPAGDGPGNAGASAVVVRVASVAITRAEVSHWMGTLGAKLFSAHSGSRMPEGLLSDPANYPRCVASLEAAAVKSPAHAHESSTELLAKCRLLYREFKAYATGYLINDQQIILIAKRMGAAMTPAQVQTRFRALAGHEYPTGAALRTYLTRNYLTVPDLLLETEVAALARRIYAQVQKSKGLSRYRGLRKQSVSATSCSPGYQVEGCANYKGQAATITPPSVLMEGLALTA